MNKKASVYSLINIIYLTFLIVWQPIKMLFIQMDGKGRIPFLLTLLVLMINLSFNHKVRKLMVSKPFVIWLIWIVYAFINLMIKGYNITSNTPIFFLVNNLFTPYLALVLTCHEGMICRSRLLKVLVIALVVYCVLGFFFMSTVRSETDSSITLGNMLAINASMLVFLLCAVRNDKAMPGLLSLFLIVFALILIVITATRKAFGVAVILLAFYGISRINPKPKNIIFVILLAVVTYNGIEYVMYNTYLGERIDIISEQAESRSEYAYDSKFLQFVGDRAPHYVYGWEIYKQHPVTGIGLYNFMHVSGYQERLHTDYMVQFAENGLIGILLFALYYLWYIKNLIKLRQINDNKSKAIIGLGWIVAVLFLGMTAWTYDMSTVFICSGVAASFVCLYNKHEIRC